METQQEKDFKLGWAIMFGIMGMMTLYIILMAIFGP